VSTVLGIDDEGALPRAVDALRGGGVVVLPTDTIPGLSAASSREDALVRIRTIKGSPDDKQFVLLAASVDMVARYVRDFGCATRETFSAVWPAPLSAVLRTGTACPGWVGDTVAIRVPDSHQLRSIVESLGEIIVSTSVNRSGETPLTDAGAIEREFGDEVDLIVTAGPARGRARASTVVDFTGDVPRVLRQGSYDWPAAAAGDSNPSK
jgi:L-threonylcarbamoyladenylate synthase